MKYRLLLSRMLISALYLSCISTAQGGTPLWTFTPLTSTTLSVPANSTAMVQYRVTNQSKKTHVLQMKPMTGARQVTTGNGVCHNPFALQGKQSCVLSIEIDGSQLTQSIVDGPIVCQQGSSNQCYRPSSANILRVTQAEAQSSATISVSGSPLTLSVNGGPGSLTITNTSNTITATNIVSDFSGTVLNGNVSESGNTCSSVAPQASCSIIYVPNNSQVAQTNFSISGSNTNTVTAAIKIDPASIISGISPSSGPVNGGTGVTITGTGLTGTSSLTFDGVQASSIHVVNSTTVTAVTPAHATGLVNVEITTPSNSSTLTNGFTYVAAAVGQPVGGGVIGCLGGGANNLVVASVDNSNSIIWGSIGLATSATSDTDGSGNTATIVATQGQTTPNAATLCDNYEVDSQGNTPCSVGNTCYNDWYLPAIGNNASSQLQCLYANRVAIGGFAATNYWSSTESNANLAWTLDFDNGSNVMTAKTLAFRVRCVRGL